MKKPPFTVEHKKPRVPTVRCVARGDKWEQWFLLRTDAHHDNPDSDREMELRHLKEAVNRGAGIIDAGDLFCAMQSKQDTKRSDKSKVRPEHQSEHYLDALVREASEFYAPFAANWVVMGCGNHESSITGHHETGLTERLIERIQMLTGVRIPSGGYTGWVRIMIQRSTQRHSVRLWYGHGWNVKDSPERASAQIGSADVFFCGHTHHAWIKEQVRNTLTDSGFIRRKTLYLVQGPSYKDEYKDGQRGYAVTKGHPPKPLGAWWMRVRLVNDNTQLQFIRAE